MGQITKGQWIQGLTSLQLRIRKKTSSLLQVQKLIRKDVDCTALVICPMSEQIAMPRGKRDDGLPAWSLAPSFLSGRLEAIVRRS